MRDSYSICPNYELMPVEGNVHLRWLSLRHTASGATGKSNAAAVADSLNPWQRPAKTFLLK